MIDERDGQILKLLQADARTSHADLGRAVGLAPSAVLERLRKLERRGILHGTTTRLAAEALGLGLLAFVFVQADEQPGEGCVGDQLAALPEAQEVHHIAGEDCYLVKVRCATTGALGRLLQERIAPLPGVRRTRTTIALGTLKETTDLPFLPPAEETR